MSRMIGINQGSIRIHLSERAAQAIRLAVWICGSAGLVAFIWFRSDGLTVFSLAVAAFVLGGLWLSMGVRDGASLTSVEPRHAVVVAAGLALGSMGAAVPSAMFGLGRTILTPNQTEKRIESAYVIMRLSAQAALTGLAFSFAGGENGLAGSTYTLLPALFAIFVYAASELLLSQDGLSVKSLLVGCGFGFALGGIVSATAGPAMLTPTLIASILLLADLRARRNEKQTDERDDAPEQSTFIDPLTGLANQRYLEIFLHQEVARAKRLFQSITIALIDIDDFSRMNAAYGEDAGDQLLCELGAQIKSALREYDVVARYKEDEFMIIMPQAQAPAGVETLIRIHTALSGKILPWKATFSAGVASYPAHGETIDNVIASAHHALNRVKFSGKDGVMGCHQLAKAS